MLLVALLSSASLMAQTPFDGASAGRFARLALDCVNKEYPNKIAHAMNSDSDVKPPRELTPAFYGCYDWHSAVHGHWLLVRAARLFPNESFAGEARAALGRSLTAQHMAQEAKYMTAEGRSTFERPYGLAWLLQLAAELKEWDDPQAREWAAAMEPLQKAVVERLRAWLPKLPHPIRTGEHNNTAFSLGLVLDAARVLGDRPLEQLVAGRGARLLPQR